MAKQPDRSDEIREFGRAIFHLMREREVAHHTRLKVDSALSRILNHVPEWHALQRRGGDGGDGRLAVNPSFFTLLDTANELQVPICALVPTVEHQPLTDTQRKLLTLAARWMLASFTARADERAAYTSDFEDFEAYVTFEKMEYPSAASRVGTDEQLSAELVDVLASIPGIRGERLQVTTVRGDSMAEKLHQGDRVLEEPEHPGVAHYLIHSFDYPELAALALPAARVYARLAPGSPHALHMPSHIFTRLGLWDESIASNLASAKKAHDYLAQRMPGAAAFDELHATDYLVYAYLQQGKLDEAQKLVAKTAAITKIDNPAQFAAAYAIGAVPARYALERRQWKEAAALTVPTVVSWNKVPYAEANIHFARGIGAARSGQVAIARDAVSRLAAIRQVLLDQKNTYWADQVEIQRLSVAAWLARAEKKDDEALKRCALPSISRPQRRSTRSRRALSFQPASCSRRCSSRAGNQTTRSSKCSASCATRPVGAMPWSLRSGRRRRSGQGHADQIWRKA